MAKVFRPSTRESNILSKIESSKEHERRKAISGLKDCIEPLSNAIAMKLIETTNKTALEQQIGKSLEKISHADDFDIDFQCSPFRHVASQPHVVSLYLTAFVIEQLINHKDVVDVYGSDEDIYVCINKQVTKFLP
ncbi:MAG: hypothetical protein V1844_15740 [Pseudomonadota bacterium]